MSAKRFPEMNGGLQLGFDLFEQEHQEQAAAGPTTVVCLKGRRDDPAIGNVVYVGRPMYQGGWRLAGHVLANPYVVGKHGTAEECVARYETWLDAHPELLARELPMLIGRQLGCWCPDDAPCHARALARRANTLRETRC